MFNRKKIGIYCSKPIIVENLDGPIITRKEKKSSVTENCRFHTNSREELKVFVVTAVFALEKDNERGMESSDVYFQLQGNAGTGSFCPECTK